MQYTDNNGLIIKEKTDNYSRENFNKCMNIIDDGLCKFYVATLESTNNYKVTTGLNKTGLNDGYSIKVAIPSDSNGAVSIIVDSVTVPVKKLNGNPVSNFKANGVYSLTYYNGNFILASGSDESDSTSVGTDGSKVLAGETFIGSDGEVHTGQIPIQNSVNSNLNCGQSISLPAGYYGAESKITGNSLASQTQANADASKIVSGYHAWVNGQDVWGNATIQSLGGKEYKPGSNVATTQYIYGNGSYRVIPYVSNYRVVVGKISYQDKIFIYINDSNICSYPITVYWSRKENKYIVATDSAAFSPTQPTPKGIPVYYNTSNDDTITVTSYLAWE